MGADLHRPQPRQAHQVRSDVTRALNSTPLPKPASRYRDTLQELMWGLPGTMLACIHMGTITGDVRFKELFEAQAIRLLAELEVTESGPIWTQDPRGAALADVRLGLRRLRDRGPDHASRARHDRCADAVRRPRAPYSGYPDVLVGGTSTRALIASQAYRPSPLLVHPLKRLHGDRPVSRIPSA